MNKDYQISENQMDHINIFSSKIMGIGSFLSNIQPDELSIDADDLFTDCGIILHSTGEKIQEIISEVQKMAMIKAEKVPE